MTLAAEAWDALDGEAHPLQVAAHLPRHRESGDARARDRPRGHCFQQIQAPHLRIAGRREAVQEPGVGHAAPRPHAFQRVRDRHINGGGKIMQVDPMEPTRAAGPAPGDRLGDVGDFRPSGQSPLSVPRGYRMSFDAEDAQPGTRRSGAPPEIEQGDDVQARAEAELSDSEVRAIRPSLGKATAPQENRA